MAELFRHYEKEFGKHLAGGNKKLALYSTVPDKKALHSELQFHVSEAEKAVRMMENQLFAMSPSESSQLKNKLNRHRETLKNLKSVSSQRKDTQQLLPNTRNLRSAQVQDARTVADSGASLDRSLALGDQTHSLATSTLTALQTQRSQLHSVKGKVSDVGTGISAANRVLTRLDRRRLLTKFLLLLIVFLLLVANTLLLVLKL